MLNMGEETKQPLRRLELAIRRITKVALPLHLDILNKHKENIERAQVQGTWARVHAEQINASRTVQQLKADIRELEMVGYQVCPEDAEEFENRVRITRDEALGAIQSFIDIYSEVTEPFSLQESMSLPVQTSNSDDLPHLTQAKVLRSPTPPVVPLPDNWQGIVQPCIQSSDLVENSDNPLFPLGWTVEGVDQETLQEQAQLLPDLQHKTQAESSWNKLKHDLLELNAMIHKFAQLVLHQRESVEAIEHNVDTAHENVTEGKKNLRKAMLRQAKFLPLAGAMIGACVGGPVGIIVGLKVGAVTGAVGGILGFTGGRLLKKQREKDKDIELTELTQRNKKGSVSLPDLSAKISENQDDVPR